MHEEAVEALARSLQNFHAGRALEQRHGFRFDAVDEVHLPGGKRRNARRGVIHDDDFDAVDIAAVRAPVGGVLFKGRTYTGFVACELVGSGADRRSRIIDAAVRLNDEVIVGQQKRQVGIAFHQRQDEIAGLFLNCLHGAHKSQRARFGAFVGVPLQGCDHVCNGEFPAIVERNVLSNLERPDRSVGRRLPGGSD